MSGLSWTSSDKISGSAHDSASHGMFCCIFLTNILQNRRKRISAKLLDDGTRHGHTLSQPVHIVGQLWARQRNVIQVFQMLDSKKGRKECGGGGGGGVGDRLESPVETHSMFVVFFSFAHQQKKPPQTLNGFQRGSQAGPQPPSLPPPSFLPFLLCNKTSHAMLNHARIQKFCQTKSNLSLTHFFK